MQGFHSTRRIIVNSAGFPLNRERIIVNSAGFPLNRERKIVNSAGFPLKLEKMQIVQGFHSTTDKEKESGEYKGLFSMDQEREN